MNRAAVEQLIERWETDPAFRDELRADPEAAVRASGADLDDDEWNTLRQLDWSLPDEELRQRVNLGGG